MIRTCQDLGDVRWTISKAHRVYTAVNNKDYVRVLAISGSLRRASSNSALVGAIARLAPDGVLKNALDWVVASGELVDKPIALINASARATHARTSLANTLSAMSARVVREASITISLGGRMLVTYAIVADASLATALESALCALACDAREARVF